MGTRIELRIGLHPVFWAFFVLGLLMCMWPLFAGAADLWRQGFTGTAISGAAVNTAFSLVRTCIWAGALFFVTRSRDRLDDPTADPYLLDRLKQVLEATGPPRASEEAVRE